MKQLVLVLLSMTSFPTFAACSVPDQLSGKTLIYVSDTAYFPSNPHPGAIMRLRFDKDKYDNTIFTDSLVTSGQYRYRRLQDSVGWLEASEAYNGQTTHYTLVLSCLTSNSGTAVYTQTQGAIKPNNRQNMARYAIE